MTGGTGSLKSSQRNARESESLVNDRHPWYRRSHAIAGTRSHINRR